MKSINVNKNLYSSLQKSKPIEMDGAAAPIGAFIVFALLKDQKVKDGVAKAKKFKLHEKVAAGMNDSGEESLVEFSLSEITSIMESVDNVFVGSEMYGIIGKEFDALEK